MKYKLNVKRDVEIEKNDFGTDYILTLPYGWRFDDEIVHVRGYDSLKELRQSARDEVIVCACNECVKFK